MLTLRGSKLRRGLVRKLGFGHVQGFVLVILLVWETEG
jgi:hypothetical protein